MNDINLIGRLVRSPELRTTQTGTSVVSFTLAVDRRDKDKSTDFIPCTAWAKTGEIINEYCVKGQLIGVTGRLQIRPFTDKEGNKRTAAEVIVSTFDFCERKTETASQAPTNDFTEIEDDGDSLPF